MSLYDSPEKYGLEIVAELSDNNLSYEYDITVVWKDDANRVFWAADSGCSCPTPFEDYRSLDDVHEITLDAWDTFFAVLSSCTQYDAGDRTQTLSRVSAILRKKKEQDALDLEVAEIERLGREERMADLMKMADQLEVTDEPI